MYSKSKYDPKFYDLITNKGPGILTYSFEILYVKLLIFLFNFLTVHTILI